MPGCINDILGHTGTYWDRIHEDVMCQAASGHTGHTGRYWDKLGWDTHKDVMCQAASRHTGTYWDILGQTGMGYMRMQCARLHQDTLGGTGMYWDGTQEDVTCQVALRNTRTYWDVLGRTGTHHDAPAHSRGTGSHWDELGTRQDAAGLGVATWGDTGLPSRGVARGGGTGATW